MNRFKAQLTSEQNRELVFKCKAYGITAFLVVAASITFYFLIDKPNNILGFIRQSLATLTPIITGLIIAFILNPVMLAYEKWLSKPTKKIFKSQERADKVTKYSAITLALITGLVALTAIILIIIPSLIDSVKQLTAELPSKMTAGFNYLSEKLPKEIVDSAQEKAMAYLNKLLSEDLLKSFEVTAGYFASSVKSVYNFVISILVGIIVSVYALSGKGYFKKIIQKLLCAFLPKNAAIEVVKTAKQTHTIFTNFIVGNIIDSIIVGIICYIGLLILNIPYALLIGFIVGITNLIPFFGPIIGAVPSTLILLVDTPIKAIYFVIFIIVLQQIDGNLLSPHILHGSLGISSFWIVFSIMLFGGLYGLIGMMIAAPLFAVIYNIVSRVINARLKKRGLPVSEDAYSDISKTLNPDKKTAAQSDETKIEMSEQ